MIPNIAPGGGPAPQATSQPKISKKRKIVVLTPKSEIREPSLLPFQPQNVQITVKKTGEKIQTTIFLTFEKAYSKSDGGTFYISRVFTLRLPKKSHPIGNLTIDYHSNHLWVEKVQNQQPEGYKGVGSALVRLAIQESFLQGKGGQVHLYSHGRTAGFYWNLGFAPLAPTISIPRYPGLEELTDKLVACKKRLSCITSSDIYSSELNLQHFTRRRHEFETGLADGEAVSLKVSGLPTPLNFANSAQMSIELWHIITEAQRILAEEQMRQNKSPTSMSGEYLLKEWFWKTSEQPMVLVDTKALFRAFFKKKPLFVEGQKYEPLPSADFLAGEMRLSEKVARIWRDRVLGS